MPSLNRTEQERVQTLYARLKESKGNISSVNETGLSRFSDIGYPGRKAELFTYVNTAKLGFPAYGKPVKSALDKDSVRSAVYSGFEKSCIVITDGIYNEGLSRISSLSAKITTPDTAAAYTDFKYAIEEESDPFAALNAAFQRETVIIELLKNSEKNMRMQILFHSSPESDATDATFSPRLFIKIPAETELELVSRFTGSGQKCFVNAFQDIQLGESSNLHYLIDQSDTSTSSLFYKSRIVLERGAACFLTQAVSGSSLTRLNNEIILAGPNSVFESRTASVTTGSEEAHIYSTVSHRARGCKSNQYFNNILLGKSHAGVDTTVEVKKSGGVAESGQLVRNTLLSSGGRAYSKPNLKIFADDVKCQHGATTGCLDEKQIFYMQSRGVNRRAAENAIIAGQVESMLADVRDPELRSSVRDKLIKKIEA